MAVKIMVKGDIISNDYKWVYNWMEWDGACPNDIADGIKEAAGDDLIVEINSPGGICNAAFEMYTALKEYEGNVEVHIIGLAASAASLIACAGDKVLISNVGIIMIHNASSGASGDYRDMESAYKSLVQYNDAILNAYCAKTGKTKDELQSLMDNTTYMAADAAIENGFADAIMEFSSDEQNNNTSIGIMNIGTGANMEAVAAVGATHIMSKEAMNKLMCKIKGLEDNPQKTDNAISDQDNASAKDDNSSGLLLNTNKSNEGGTPNMTLEELRKEHPELAKEIDEAIASAREEGRNEGAENERNRIKGIDSISGSVPADMVEKAKYTDIETTASALALKVMKKNAEAGKNYIQDAVDDSENSGIKDVKNNPDAGKEDEEEKEVDALVAAANGRKGGRR